MPYAASAGLPVLHSGAINANGYPHAVKENMISQTRPPFCIVLLCSSHMLIVNTFGWGHGSLWTSRPDCSYTASYATNFNTLCVLSPFYQELTKFSFLSKQELLYWIGLHRPTFTSACVKKPRLPMTLSFFLLPTHQRLQC